MVLEDKFKIILMLLSTLTLIFSSIFATYMYFSYKKHTWKIDFIYKNIQQPLDQIFQKSKNLNNDLNLFLKLQKLQFLKYNIEENIKFLKSKRFNSFLLSDYLNNSFYCLTKILLTELKQDEQQKNLINPLIENERFFDFKKFFKIISELDDLFYNLLNNTYQKLPSTIIKEIEELFQITI